MCFDIRLAHPETQIMVQRFFITEKQSALKKIIIAIVSVLHFFNPSAGFSQCVILPNAVPGISYTYVQTGGTNASGVAYYPDSALYYAVIAGNSGFPMETFDINGVSLYQTTTGFDFRGLWWNKNTNQLEGNGFATFGLWTPDLDVNGYALSTGTSIFTGQNQPDVQSCGDYDDCANEILYYLNGSIYRYSRATNAFLGSYTLTGLPVPIGNLNITSLAYTGCAGNEIALEDYVNKTILLFDKSTGAYSATSQLPSTAVTNVNFRFSFANGMIWLYDVNARTWTSYSIFENNNNGLTVNLGNDTTLCEGETLVLTAGSSLYNFTWSTGATDTAIVVDSAGTYWVSYLSGACALSDTIIISDTLCSPLLAIGASDTTVCEKFCVSFFDSSLNNPTAWLWLFEGGAPSTSTSQNPANICYSTVGTYDVTLITTSANGMDTLTLPDYITVTPTPPFPTITQNGLELTCSVADAYQWQFNSVDIPGATDQTYTATQTGLYTVYVFDANGCKNSASVSIVISGLEGLALQPALTIFPNPNAGIFNIHLSGVQPNSSMRLLVMNTLGETIYEVEMQLDGSSWNREINLPGIAAGIYQIGIQTGNTVFYKKMVIGFQ